MKRFFRHFAFAAFGVSILCLALGIAMLIWTATAMKWISYGFGAVMILSGILQIASYLTGERVGLLRKLLLISGIIADEAAIGMVNQKTTAVRVIPVAGKGVGEMANFGGLMGYAPIMPVNQTSCEAFVTRGGRIPAPIHSFKN